LKSIKLHIPHFEQLYQDFKKYFVTVGYRSNKKGLYLPAHIKEFLSFIENKGITTIQVVTTLHIIEYKSYIQERPHAHTGVALSDSTVREHIYTVGLFFDYLLNAGEITASPAYMPRFGRVEPIKPRNIATIEEIKELYTACETKRDSAILAVAYGCGLRRNELHLLNVSDVLLRQGMIIVRNGKGGKSRTVPMSDTVVKDLKEYIIHERPLYFNKKQTSHTHALYVNMHGKRMSGDKIAERLQSIISRTNNPNLLKKHITLHCLRHSIATHLLDKGATIEFVQSFLGHANIDTSHLYAKRRKLKTTLLQKL
jgi:site-specific recombinase XerD